MPVVYVLFFIYFEYANKMKFEYRFIRIVGFFTFVVTVSITTRRFVCLCLHTVSGIQYK